MTPKEKAQELFNKMDMVIYTDQDNWKWQCKQCALIAVDEIIQLRKGYFDCTNSIQDESYWQEVKQEINLL